MKLGSYPKVYNLGHPAIRDLFDGTVAVQEKVDGSQFSFGIIDGELHMRSRGTEVFPSTPDKLFAPAVETVRSIQEKLTPGWVYRGEVLTRRKHNTLTYDRTPEGFVVLFDIEVGEQDFLDPAALAVQARKLGLEVVPCWSWGAHPFTLDSLESLLHEDSFLGGTKVEGVVVKNYERFGRDGKALMGKHVSEAFKEKHGADWKKRNPNRADLVETLVSEYRTEARWEKAYQHLRDAGEIEEDPRDIGKLFKEVHRDFDEECAEEVAERLYKHFAASIKKGVASGMAEWYKAKLAEKQFEGAA